MNDIDIILNIFYLKLKLNLIHLVIKSYLVNQELYSTATVELL